MTKPKHTPGPWSVRNFSSKTPDTFRVYGANETNGLAICGSEANARLIAAAPEMLELLTIAQNYVVIAGDPRSVELHEAIINLIAKATGGEG